MIDTLALELPSTLSTRLQRLAQAAALPVDRFVVQTLEATLEDEQLVRPTTTHQESVFLILHRMAANAQERMAILMTRNTEGDLTAAEEAELAALVAEYEQIMLANSEQLLRMQQPMAGPVTN